MFGYIKVSVGELRVREHRLYRAVYCGLCGDYGRRTGCTSRLTLSYDFTFLLLVRMAVFGITPEFEKRRCPAHIFKKQNMMATNEESRYTARVAAILAYYKTLDDIADERGFKRFLSRLALPFARRMRRRALRGDSSLLELDTSLRDLMESLSECERERLASVDIPANIFGEMMAKILSHGLSDDATKMRLCRQVGYYIGKWIYIIDALDDYDSDIRAKRYNPFACLYGAAGIPDTAKEDIKVALTATLMEAELGYNLIEYDKSSDILGIIENIIYIGMPRVADEIIFGKDDKERTEYGKPV